MPQAYLLLTLAFADGGYGANIQRRVIDINSYLFYGTFSLSIAAAIFGTAKFLKSGPTRIVRNDKCVDGFGTMTFILIFFNVAATLIGRGMVMSWVIVYLVRHGRSKFYYLLLLLNFLPQLVHVSLISSGASLDIFICKTFTGIWHSLLRPWHQEGDKDNHNTPSTSSDTRCHLLDIRSA